MQPSRGHQEMMNNQRNQQPPPPQDRRLKPLAAAGGDSSQAAAAAAAAAAALQQHPPQKCPRCESMNTKFCYYNNYSLTQPRYFCKACRRYWTQGGTLRNVPVGGGCRKGKRAKITSSSHSASTTASSSLSQPQSHQQLNAMTSNPAGLVSSTGMGQFYPGNDFLSSLTAGQPSNQLPGFSSADLACGSSNMSLLQGYAALQFSQAFHQTQAQLYGQFGNREKGTSSEMENTLYTSDQERLIQASNSQSHQQNWRNQSLLGHSSTVSDGTNLWTIGSTTTTTTSKGTSTTNTTSGAPLNPNQWPDLPGFGAP